MVFLLDGRCELDLLLDLERQNRLCIGLALANVTGDGLLVVARVVRVVRVVRVNRVTGILRRGVLVVVVLRVPLIFILFLLLDLLLVLDIVVRDLRPMIVALVGSLSKPHLETARTGVQVDVADGV